MGTLRGEYTCLPFNDPVLNLSVPLSMLIEHCSGKSTLSGDLQCDAIEPDMEVVIFNIAQFK